MEIRILKPEEYHWLDSIPEPDRVKLDPNNTWVAVALDDGKVVGRIVALSLPHIECVWIDPAYRGGTLLSRLEKYITSKLMELGARLAVAYATDKKMESYIKRLGYTKFATAWRKDI